MLATLGWAVRVCIAADLRIERFLDRDAHDVDDEQT
jgi:hypothetical protein